MREFEAKFGDREVKLAATFKASLEIAQKVADPLFIMREAMLEVMLIDKQIPYEPKWRFTVENIPLILFIGARAAGEKVTPAEMEELVFEAGYVASREIASEYLAMIVGPRPENLPTGEGESEGNAVGSHS